MARTVLTRERILQLDPEILEKNGFTREQLLDDLVDYEIKINEEHGGIIRMKKRSTFGIVINGYRLTKGDYKYILGAVGLSVALIMGAPKIFSLAIDHATPNQDKAVKIEDFLAKGEYDTCNAFLSDAMIKLDEYTKTTDGTQRNYYLGMVEEMQSLRAEVNRAYREYEEREALGVDSSAALATYKDAFKDFVEKASSIGIHYVPVEQTLEEWPKLS